MQRRSIPGEALQLGVLSMSGGALAARGAVACPRPSSATSTRVQSVQVATCPHSLHREELSRACSRPLPRSFQGPVGPRALLLLLPAGDKGAQDPALLSTGLALKSLLPRVCRWDPKPATLEATVQGQYVASGPGNDQLTRSGAAAQPGMLVGGAAWAGSKLGSCPSTALLRPQEEPRQPSCAHAPRRVGRCTE